jgi:signal transduction histidine kinase
MAIVVFCVALGYTVFDLSSGMYDSWPYQTTCSALALISFFFNRQGKHTLAKVILVLAANFTVYIFVSSENIPTELNVFFVVIAIATIAGFGYEQRYLALIFVILTLGLYLSTTIFEFKPVQNLDYSVEYVKESKMINFVAGIVAASLIVFALITVNFHSEKALREGEQAMIRKNEQLTELNIELDKFVYSSSHDLMAPLRSILGLVNLCNLSEDREETKKYLSMVKDRVSELEKFIKEMSDYSKNSRQAVVVEEIDMRKMFREVLETLRFYPHAEKLLVDVDIQEDLTIHSDHTRLKVIFSNIISNCFKYCDLNKKESFVRIAASRIPGMIYVEIEDNGLGIKDLALPKIFDMFYRAHDHGEGTGLGLYIVKEAIEKVGGTIAVHSNVGRGTTFKITLPTKINS